MTDLILALRARELFDGAGGTRGSPFVARPRRGDALARRTTPGCDS